MIALACLVAGPAMGQGSGSATLDAVRGRGQLLCGTSGEITGFSLPDSKGVMQGLDADGCRAIAAAVLGDAGKVRFVPLTAQNRFTALQSGEVDVLIRNTGWSLTREASPRPAVRRHQLLGRHQPDREDGQRREACH